jgi:hypothetical protein
MADRTPLATGLLALDAPSNATHLFAQQDRVRYYRARATNGQIVYLMLDHHDLDLYTRAALCEQMNDFLDKSSADPLPVIVEVCGSWQNQKTLAGQTVIVMEVFTSTLIKDRAMRAPFIQRNLPKISQAKAA